MPKITSRARHVAWWATEQERNDGDVVYASTSRQELRGLYLRFRDYDFVPQRKEKVCFDL